MLKHSIPLLCKQRDDGHVTKQSYMPTAVFSMPWICWSFQSLEKWANWKLVRNSLAALSMSVMTFSVSALLGTQTLQYYILASCLHRLDENISEPPLQGAYLTLLTLLIPPKITRFPWGDLNRAHLILVAIMLLYLVVLSRYYGLIVDFQNSSAEDMILVQWHECRPKVVPGLHYCVS